MRANRRPTLFIMSRYFLALGLMLVSAFVANHANAASETESKTDLSSVKQTEQALYKALAASMPNESITLEVKPNGADVTVSIKLGQEYEDGYLLSLGTWAALYVEQTVGVHATTTVTDTPNRARENNAAMAEAGGDANSTATANETPTSMTSAFNISGVVGFGILCYILGIAYLGRVAAMFDRAARKTSQAVVSKFKSSEFEDEATNDREQTKIVLPYLDDAIQSINAFESIVPNVSPAVTTPSAPMMVAPVASVVNATAATAATTATSDTTPAIMPVETPAVISESQVMVVAEVGTDIGAEIIATNSPATYPATKHYVPSLFERYAKPAFFAAAFATFKTIALFARISSRTAKFASVTAWITAAAMLVITTFTARLVFRAGKQTFAFMSGTFSVITMAFLNLISPKRLFKGASATFTQHVEVAVEASRSERAHEDRKVQAMQQQVAFFQGRILELETVKFKLESDVQGLDHLWKSSLAEVDSLSKRFHNLQILNEAIRGNLQRRLTMQTTSVESAVHFELEESDFKGSVRDENFTASHLPATKSPEDVAMIVDQLLGMGRETTEQQARTKNQSVNRDWSQTPSMGAPLKDSSNNDTSLQ